MSETKNNNQGETTIIEPQVKVNEVHSAQSAAPAADSVEGAPKKKRTIRAAVLGVLAGAGVAGSLGMISPEQNEESDTPPFDGAGVAIADAPNDDMSFDEAFAAAREQVGPGGVFQWHGQNYGTYYQEEWDQLTPQQQHDFSNFQYDTPKSDYVAPEPITGEPSVVDELEEGEGDDSENNEPGGEEPDGEDLSGSGTEEIPTDGDGNISILDGTLDVDEDGNIIGENLISDDQNILIDIVDVTDDPDLMPADEPDVEMDVVDVVDDPDGDMDAVDETEMQDDLFDHDVQADDLDMDDVEIDGSDGLADYVNDATVDDFMA